jgi:hypothetical protein
MALQEAHLWAAICHFAHPFGTIIEFEATTRLSSRILQFASNERVRGCRKESVFHSLTPTEEAHHDLRMVWYLDCWFCIVGIFGIICRRGKSGLYRSSL